MVCLRITDWWCYGYVPWKIWLQDQLLYWHSLELHLSSIDLDVVPSSTSCRQEVDIVLISFSHQLVLDLASRAREKLFATWTGLGSFF